MLYQTCNPHGGDVYARPVKLDFSANINPLGTPPAVVEAVERGTRELFRYPDPYCRALVGAIAAFEGVPEEQILCGSGAAELIFSFCAALRPKKALIPVPTFSEYETALWAAGCAVQRYMLSPREGFALTADFLSALETSDAEAVFLCNPNNPTGLTAEPALLEDIARICREKGVRLFVDECFLDLTQGGGALSLKKALGDNRQILLLKAFTKSYGMAGLRLGYCLCADQALLGAMSRTVQPWNVSLPAQLAGTAALGEQDFLNRARAIIESQRPRLLEQLRGLGLQPIPSRANYILFRSPRELYEPLMERGIQIRRCANYPGLGPEWYRIAVKLPEENIQLLNAMEEILHG